MTSIAGMEIGRKQGAEEDREGITSVLDTSRGVGQPGEGEGFAGVRSLLPGMPVGDSDSGCCDGLPPDTPPYNK